MKFITTFLALVITIHISKACTVFILTDGTHTYFFNNEDYTNPNTRLWFVPGGKGFYGAAYVGFNDGEPQGGFNTKGLAFDWVTVESDSYTTDINYIPGENLVRLKFNTSQWMLERCKTVEEAIKFYQTYSEPAFARTTLVIADKSGASVVIGSKDGKIYFDTSRQCRSLGYGEKIFQKLFKPEIRANSTEGARMLNQCIAPGDGGTKYSNSYDLNTGDIVFYNLSEPTEKTKLNLEVELKKGAHYYEPGKIARQVLEPLTPLMLNMNRHILFINTPLGDQEPAFTAKIRNLFSTVADGKLKVDDLTENFAKYIQNNETAVKSLTAKLGQLKSLSLIYKGKAQEFVDYSYVIKFEKGTVLWQFLVTPDDKINDFNTLRAALNR